MLVFQSYMPVSRRDPPKSYQATVESLSDSDLKTLLLKSKDFHYVECKPEIWEYAARLNYFALINYPSSHSLFSSDASPADFKRQLVANSLPVPSDDVIAGIMKLGNTDELALELNEKICTIRRDSNSLILYMPAQVASTSDLSTPSLFTEGIIMLLDIAPTAADPVMVCAAALNAAENSQAIIQVRKKITAIGNENNDPDLLSRATEYARNNPLRNLLPKFSSKS